MIDYGIPPWPVDDCLPPRNSVAHGAIGADDWGEQAPGEPVHAAVAGAAQEPTDIEEVHRAIGEDDASVRRPGTLGDRLDPNRGRWADVFDEDSEAPVAMTDEDEEAPDEDEEAPVVAMTDDRQAPHEDEEAPFVAAPVVAAPVVAGRPRRNRTNQHERQRANRARGRQQKREERQKREEAAHPRESS